MSTRGRRWAFVFGLAIVFALPKRVDCGLPGATCAVARSFNRTCTMYEVEPFGFYLIERLVGADVGFAYTTDETCR